MGNKKSTCVSQRSGKLSQQTFKETINSTTYVLVTKLNNDLKPFISHCSRIHHQFKVIKHIKDNLEQNEVLLHFDFSQNYSCKYSSEIQSVHFGASRQQVTLHTSVLYYTLANKSNQHKSFCSISKSLRHDPPAVCAHLTPVIEEIKNIVPEVKKCTF